MIQEHDSTRVTYDTLLIKSIHMGSSLYRILGPQIALGSEYRDTPATRILAILFVVGAAHHDELDVRQSLITFPPTQRLEQGLTGRAAWRDECKDNPVTEIVSERNRSPVRIQGGECRRLGPAR